MAQYPVSDRQGILDGLNYVLSGPTGSGQNFTGFNDSQTVDLNGNFRAPFTAFNGGTLPNTALYVAPISISAVQMIDARTIKLTFTTPQVTQPFALGQAYGLTGTGFTPSGYDNYITNECFQIGVFEYEGTGPYTAVYIRAIKDLPLLAAGTGGTIGIDSMGLALSTDCNAKVTVTGGQDRVFLNAQLNNSIFLDTATTGSFYYKVEINRYKGYPNQDVNTPGYYFQYDATVASVERLLTVSATSIVDPQENLFVSIFDTPVTGYYWYILEVTYTDNAGGCVVAGSLLGQRSFSAQVLKP